MSKLIAYVGRSHVAGFQGGGIDVFEIGEGGKTITPLNNGAAEWPKYAGFLAFAPEKKVLYAVDERKDDGRGPNFPHTTVMAFKADPETGALNFINKQYTVGSSTAAVCVDPSEKYVYTCSHGKFDVVVKVVETADGKWVNQYMYDDSAVAMYPVDENGALGECCDAMVLTGHGRDPSPSPQGNYHSQASAHAHIVMVDPSGKFMVVCEKASEKVYVYRLGEDRLVLASLYQLPLGSGPRHCIFDKNGYMYMTCEFSNEIWSFKFDSELGILYFVDKQITVADDFKGRNELATIQVTPNGQYVYVNNRGEDTIVGFAIDADGKMKKSSVISVGKTPADPKDGVRDMKMAPDGSFLLVPVRPDDVLRSYAIDYENGGALTPITETPVENPVTICWAQL